MIKIDLHTTGNQNLGTIDFPEHPGEVKLSHFISFQKAYEKYHTFFSSVTDKDFLTRADEITLLKMRLECVCAFCDMDLSKLPTGAFKDPFWIQSRPTILTLFSAIWQTLAKYEKQEDYSAYSFEYDGKKWTIPTAYRDAITNKERFSEVETARTVEALEAWRAYETVLKEDETGGYYFKTLLNIIACFARTEGEVFPDSDDMIAKFLSERVVYFKDVSMKIALDVHNFFFATSNLYEEISDLIISLVRRNESLMESMK